MAPRKWQKRVDSGDWEPITAQVNDFGGALLPRLLTPTATSKIRRLYLDCPSALRAIDNGGYIKHRVFFADEATAVAAGYRPCAHCQPGRYHV